ncbi:MAG TPA: hypothetical protein VGN32_17165 [Ktedonobacterales bacterium]|jgi:hypothetical protein|nr:hypothetical protein [Ktedonobacterales bacterium]
MSDPNRMPQDLESASDSSAATDDVSFSVEEMGCLEALRERYAQRRDLFSEAELARLRFLRWLVDTGRLAV